MSSDSTDPPTRLDEASQLRQRLRQLGHAPKNPPLSGQLEEERAKRVAARLDQELSQLVARRSRMRLLWGSGLACAAAALLLLGLRSGSIQRATTLITQERLRPAPGPRSTVVAMPATAPVVPTVSGRVAHPVREPLRRASAPIPAPVASSTFESRSTLGEENRLFQEAAEASRRGDVDAALALLDRLLGEFPGSPLAQTALVRRFRLLAKSGRAAEARRDAERYLKAYPTGFAVSEAQALQAEGVRPDVSQPSNASEGAEP